jgi:hypothetical protein
VLNAGGQGNSMATGRAGELPGASQAASETQSLTIILLFGLKPILPSRPACGTDCRAQPPSRLPKAPEGLGLYGGEHGGMFKDRGDLS